MVVRFFGAEEGPLLVLVHAAREQDGDPQGIEQVAGSLLPSPMFPLELEEVEDIRMPRLQVQCKGALALPTTMIGVAGGLVEVPEHGDQTIDVPIRALDVSALCPDI